MDTCKHYFLLCLCVCLGACVGQPGTFPDISRTTQGGLSVSTNDTLLASMFRWASERSESYVGNVTDPVGPWYEAALPGREAFCMRDVSHQCIGEEINGHREQNRNMFARFVENISEGKDYCTYWEINKDNLPAPVDYEDDGDFWYNLNANFDLMDACYRLYLWTGDTTYTACPAFLEFFSLTAGEYMERWMLEAGSIMERRAVMNERGDTSRKRFKGVRGLPSYEESVSNLRVTGDLLAAIYRGLHSYASILLMGGEKAKAERMASRAEAYAQLYDSLWWNAETGNYYSYWLDDGTFKEGGTNMFPLWFCIVREPERIESILRLMETTETNVETMSYYPVVFYRNGRPEQGYRFLRALYENGRRDYPEVASAMLEGIVSGTAGLHVDASRNTVETCPSLTGQTSWLAVENIPVLSGKLSLIHYSNKATAVMNKTPEALIWRAMFPGDLARIEQDGFPLEVSRTEDALGNVYSYAEVLCPAGELVRLEGFN